MKVHFGRPVRHWSTTGIKDWYLSKMHSDVHVCDLKKEDYTRLDKLIVWLLDKCQNVLNITFNNLFIWIGCTEKVRIDNWDVWSADHTLALIIYPTLLKLKELKHGSPYVDDDDVPDELKSTSAPAKENEYYTDDNFHKRWDWVLNELIWTFSQLTDHNADMQFHTGEIDIQWKTVEVDGIKYNEMVRGPKDTHVYDKEGHDKWNDRIKNGLRLFGKYYRGLWD